MIPARPLLQQTGVTPPSLIFLTPPQTLVTPLKNPKSSKNLWDLLIFLSSLKKTSLCP